MRMAPMKLFTFLALATGLALGQQPGSLTPSLSWRNDVLEAFSLQHEPQEGRDDRRPLFLQEVSPQCQEDYEKFKLRRNDTFLFTGRNDSGLWAQKSEL